MKRPEPLSKEQQGRYVYEIFVARSGNGWGWEIVRISEIAAALVHARIVEEGQAWSREVAIEAAKATCRRVMERNRGLDTVN
jgi:hypothetical protein